ncbi:heterocyst-inhibiting protein PatX [Allocoleopsis sp.]|uniref:heterocyst-inhibiting protein PatX n=1 Tax=Allocoleopsis sp. TaxID=3088169 RepID=UPI0039C8A451
MQTYSSLLLTSLLFTGIAANSPHFGSGGQRLHPSDFETQSLTNKSSAQSDCRDSGQSPLPGCGRRDKEVTKGN